MDWTAQSILELRHAAGYTQKQLAEWLRVTVKQVKHLENKRRNPSGPVTHLLDILKGQLQGGKTSNAFISPIVILSTSQHESPQTPKPRSRKLPTAAVTSPSERVEAKDVGMMSVDTPDPEVSTRDDAFLWQA